MAKRANAQKQKRAEPQQSLSKPHQPPERTIVQTPQGQMVKLQQAVGNRAVSALLKEETIGTNRVLSPSGDPSTTRTTDDMAEILPYPYALMSKAAYERQDNASQASFGKRKLKLQGWELLDSFTTNDGYSGIAYINHGTKEVAISHRGTERLKPWGGSDLDDDLAIARGKAPDQYFSSRPFVTRIRERLQETEMIDYKIRHTGHSLGAVLADLHAIEHGENSITFENPGAQSAAAELGLSPARERHISYQSRSNLINTSNPQIGSSVRLGARHPALLGPMDRLLHEHSIDTVIDDIDPITGRPYASCRIGEDAKCK